MDSRTHVFAALVEFQANCPPIDKDSQVTVKTKSGGQYTFDYASFGNIIQSIKVALAGASLGYTFYTTENRFVCRILHKSGEFFDTAIPLASFGNDMQENGSKLTYQKRYSLVLALGLDTDGDDDGNAGQGNDRTLTQKTRSQQPQASKGPEYSQTSQQAAREVKASKLVTEAQLKRLFAMQQKSRLKQDEVQAMIKMRWNKTTSKELTMTEYEEIISVIEANMEA